MEKHIKIAYIGGGSKQWARVFMSDLAVSEGLRGQIALYDIDLDAAQRNATIGNSLASHPLTRSVFEYSVCPRLEDALEHKYLPPQNFYGIGGMKIFRDLIWLMQGMMRADHKFYKSHGQYDFPQKKRGMMLSTCRTSYT